MNDRGWDAEAWLRRALLIIITLGLVGLLTELILLGHTESLAQWSPLAGFAAALFATLGVAVRPGRATIRTYRIIMAALLVTGAIGIVLHLQGNIEFELEMDPGVGGLALWWEALRGATPAIAPGAMVQLGLLGLAYTFRHPALSPPANRERAAARSPLRP